MLSDDSKKEALKRFPELSPTDRLFDNWENPTECWMDLILLFEKAYKEPRNEDAIRRIYDYAFWCLDQPQGKTAEDDLAT